MKSLFNRNKSIASTSDKSAQDKSTQFNSDSTLSAGTIAGKTPDTQKTTTLLFCILMDLVGYATYSIPFLGEFGDLLWAPISAIIFYKTFGGWRGAFGGIFNFVEELLPFTDFVPSFTIMWLLRSKFSFMPGLKTAKG
ncbi:hypothetical protein [Flavitalea sp.]|nr:hypothetical protein [Flavitalea sp.]